MVKSADRDFQRFNGSVSMMMNSMDEEHDVGRRWKVCLLLADALPTAEQRSKERLPDDV